MALTIYPDTGYDSLCSLADMSTLISLNIPSSQRTAWEALTDAEKEITARQATTLIKQKITLPTTLEDNLKLACSYLANHSVGVDMTKKSNSNNVKKKSIAKGTVATEYFGQTQASNAFPTLVTSLLSRYDVSKYGTSGGTVTFLRG